MSQKNFLKPWKSWVLEMSVCQIHSILPCIPLGWNLASGSHETLGRHVPTIFNVLTIKTLMTSKLDLTCISDWQTVCTWPKAVCFLSLLYGVDVFKWTIKFFSSIATTSSLFSKNIVCYKEMTHFWPTGKVSRLFSEPLLAHCTVLSRATCN